MPMKRQSSIEPLSSAVELLSFLQVEGHLKGIEMPHWMPGTSVAELLEALQYLGDAEWLDGAYPNHGLQESADRWVSDFLSGGEVPKREDVASEQSEDGDDSDDELDEDAAMRMLDEYASELPSAAARQAFSTRIGSDIGFRAAAMSQVAALGKAVAACAVLPEEHFSDQEEASLKEMSAEDKDLVAIARYYLLDKGETVVAMMGFPPDMVQASAGKRMEAMFHALTGMAPAPSAAANKPKSKGSAPKKAKPASKQPVGAPAKKASAKRSRDKAAASKKP